MKTILGSALLISILFTSDAYAYLDPGTGSILIQGLIAALAGGLYTLKIYWHKVKYLFSKKEDAPVSGLDSDETNSNEDAV